MARSLRVLHVNSGLKVGGIESWLLSISRVTDKKFLDINILVGSSCEQPLSKQVEETGVNVLYCCPIRSVFQYAIKFFRLVKKHGPYDVIHVHIGPLSGFVLALAWIAGIPVRITHSHGNHLAEKVQSPPWHIFREIARELIGFFSTSGVAVSREAACALFGNKWEEDSRFRILPCGIEVSRFVSENDSLNARRSLGIPIGVPVVGHVGGFRPVKNHKFLLKIAYDVIRRIPHAVFLLVGDGELKEEISMMIRDYKLDENILLTGERYDVPFLLAAMDCFVFPSFREGFPLALIEAQTAGIPCVISETITPKADIAPFLVSRLNLNNGPTVWAEKILAVIKQPKTQRRDFIYSIKNTQFDIEVSVRNMYTLYLQNLGIQPTTTITHKVIRSKIDL